MRLGIDITPLQIAAPSGIGVATYNTVRALALREDLEIVLYARSAPVVPFSGEALDLGLELRLGSGLTARAGNIAWLQYGVAPMLAKDRIDVFWGTRHVLPRNAGDIALVATLYDFWSARFPAQMPVANRTLNRAVMRALMRDGDVFTAISHDVARDARAFFPKSAEKVRTVYMGLDAAAHAPADAPAIAAMRERLGVRGPFVLALDVHNPRKNFSAVLEAVAALPAGAGPAGPGPGPAALAGPGPAGAAPAPAEPIEIVAVGEQRAAARDLDVARRAQQLGLSSRVHFVGDVSHADLLALYTACSAFVYPSVYEGFGMPVLEAMACGAPVICSNTSSLPEVAGDAALSIDPGSADQLAAALATVLGDPAEAQRLRGLGLIRAREFTWTRTAAGMRAAFEDAISARHMA